MLFTGLTNYINSSSGNKLFYILRVEAVFLLTMIDKFYIRQNYQNQAIKITLTNGIVIDGVIIDDSADYCRFVKNPNLHRYRDTSDENIVEKVYFKDMRSIDYQKK